MNKIPFLLALTVLYLGCNQPKARKPVQQKSGSFIEASAERNIKLLQEETEQIKTFMEAHPEYDFKASNSGFWYYYKIKDTTSMTLPSFGDRVLFTYTVKDLDNKTIVSEAENGLQDYRVDQTNQDLISGIRDGIKLMRQGEQITFLLPSYKAYGYYGLEDKLGANVPIQTTVTLKSIEKNQ